MTAIKFRKFHGLTAYTAHLDDDRYFRSFIVTPADDGWRLRYEVAERNGDGTLARWLDERAYHYRTREQAQGAAHALVYEIEYPNVVALLPTAA